MLIPATLPVTTNETLQTEVTSFSETYSVDSLASSEDEDIITIVTADRVSASVLHADSNTSSISGNLEQDITPLCSPSRESNTKQTDNVTVKDVASMDMTSVPQVRSDVNNKKLMRFQDASHDHEAQRNSITAAVDKVFIQDLFMYLCILYMLCVY